jgi:ABC-type lipoprotein export system ATPase subunit
MVAGRDLNACNEAELAAFRRTTIGFVFQSHHLLPQLSVVENVLVPLLAEPSLVTDGSLENRANNFSIEWGCLIGWIIVRGNFLEVKDSALLWFEP